MREPPFAVDIDLPRWAMLWAELELKDTAEDDLSTARREVVEEVRDSLNRESLARHRPIAVMRSLFRATGCDPTRYRPSSEALLRRILKGDDLPAIHPFVDLGNCLSARLAVPVCVMAEGSFSPPFVFRAGGEGEQYDSLRGPFNAEKKPLLVDSEGPCDTPITGSQRVKVRPDTRRVWLVAYLPAEAVSPEEASAELDRLLSRAPVATVTRSGAAARP